MPAGVTLGSHRDPRLAESGPGILVQPSRIYLDHHSTTPVDPRVLRGAHADEVHLCLALPMLVDKFNDHLALLLCVD